jgi:transcriptional regulator with XRE-family HTH domain
MEEEEQLTLGEYVRRLRRKKRWDLQALSNASTLSVSHLSRLENDNAVPKPESVVKLSNALDGDLDLMLQLAACLPQEILERLIRRTDQSAPVLRRATGEAAIDPGFPAALIEDLDPVLRETLAARFELSVDDVNGIFTVLQRIAQMTPSERKSVLNFLAASAGGIAQ